MKTWLVNHVERSCDGCKLQIADVKWSRLNPGALDLVDVEFRSGDPRYTHLKVRIARVVIRPNVLALMSSDLNLGFLALIQPDVLYYDGIKPKSNTKEKSDDQSPAFTFALKRARIVDGAFTYVRDVRNTHAELHVKALNVECDAIDSKAPERETHIKATATVEGSGEAELDLRGPLLKQPLALALELRVRHQDLAGLSRFFRPNAGVDLKGELVQGYARSRISGSTVRTLVRALHKDFRLHVDKTYDRSDVEAFFTNLGAAIALQTQNLEDPRWEQKREVERTREPGESIASFILRGMRDASLDIVKRMPEEK